MSTDQAPGHSPTDPTPSTVLPAPSAPSATAPGPITKLPLEILVHTLHQLRKSCYTPIERQADSVKFSRVCRSFYSAWRLSDAVHECVVDKVKGAAQLNKLLLSPGGSSLRPYSIVLKFDCVDVDEVVSDLVSSCAAELRTFIWAPRLIGKDDESEIRPGLIRAWADCRQLTKFSFGREYRTLEGGEAQRLLASWPRMVDLDMFNFNINTNDASLHDPPTSSWTVSNRLRTLSLFVDSDEVLALLANLIKASTPSLTHLTTQLYGLTQSSLANVTGPLGQSITHLAYSLHENSEGEFSLALPLLAALPGVRTATLPIGALASSGADELPELGRSFSLIKLYEHVDGGYAHMDHVFKFLKRFKVDRLELSRDSWQARIESAAESMVAESDDDESDRIPELEERWMDRLQSLAGTVELV